MEPTTATATATAASIFTMANLKWVLGGGLVIYVIKVIVGATQVKETSLQNSKDIQEMKGDIKQILKVSNDTAQRVARLEGKDEAK